MDITDRKRAGEALQNPQAELIRVARLTTMGELLASIAHEINQPLAAVARSSAIGFNCSKAVLTRLKPHANSRPFAKVRVYDGE